MVFRVERASDPLKNQPPPCVGAKLDTHTPLSIGGHNNLYSIEFNSLEELIDFVHNYNDIVIFNDDPILRICIYDGYIE